MSQETITFNDLDFRHFELLVKCLKSISSFSIFSIYTAHGISNLVMDIYDSISAKLGKIERNSHYEPMKISIIKAFYIKEYNI